LNKSSDEDENGGNQIEGKHDGFHSAYKDTGW
jgi:hypothetical protein